MKTMTLTEIVASSCGISTRDAEREIDSAVEVLKADLEDNGQITYDDFEEVLYDLGLDMDDDNIESLMWKLI